MEIYDTENGYANIYVMPSCDGKNVYVSFGRGSLSVSTYVSKNAAREFAENILEILEEMGNDDNSAQIPMPFMTAEAA